MIKSPRLTNRPHRLEDQDATLSRLRPEFESPWGHKKRLSGRFCLKTESSIKWALFNHSICIDFQFTLALQRFHVHCHRRVGGLCGQGAFARP